MRADKMMSKLYRQMMRKVQNEVLIRNNQIDIPEEQLLSLYEKVQQLQTLAIAKTRSQMSKTK